MCCNTFDPQTIPLLLVGILSGRKLQREIFISYYKYIWKFILCNVWMNPRLCLNPRSSQTPPRGIWNRHLTKLVCLCRNHPFIEWHIMPQPYPSINLNYQRESKRTLRNIIKCQKKSDLRILASTFELLKTRMKRKEYLGSQYQNCWSRIYYRFDSSYCATYWCPALCPKGQK